MPRLDLLCVSLLATIAACSDRSLAAEAGDSGSESEATTASSEQGTEAGTEAGTETGEVCESTTCLDPVEVADGIVRCADGALNRRAEGTFDPSIVGPPGCVGTEDERACDVDADCTEGAHGRCVSESFNDGVDWLTRCGCVYSCIDDSECGDDEACVPAGLIGDIEWPTCQPALCKSDADCGECGECGLGAYSDGCRWNYTLLCRAPTDACRADAECDLSCAPFKQGLFDDPVWMCTYQSCAAGRPLRVAEGSRTAPARARGDWRGGADLAELAPDRARADPWIAIASLEHASVASFARFGQQLMSLGAPPALLRATLAAARDEIVHAQLAYALASAYAGARVGPGKLELAGVAIDGSWREIVRALIEEACVGETLGVVEALADLEQARPACERAALERIARDEQRHAQLAWRSLAWLLAQREASERAWALGVLDAALGQLRARPGDSARARLHRRAGREVLEPVAAALRERVA